MRKMICDCCGKEFYSEYYEGGYIDHYENFASRMDKWGKDIKSDIREICFHGNDLREKQDMLERFNCYKQCKTVSDEFKTEIDSRINSLLSIIENAKIKAKEISSGLTAMERKYLRREVSDNCHECYGYEDNVVREILMMK
jgi:hypothetical protein